MMTSTSTIIVIPLFSMGHSERQSLINYIHESNVNDYDNDELHPYVSAFNIACKWESEVFAFSLYTKLYIHVDTNVDVDVYINYIQSL